MWLLSACVRAAPDPEPPPPAPDRPYADVVAAVEAHRLALAAAGASRDEARAALLAHVADEVLPAWFGTGWDFYGTASEPGAGDIACGHFVGTVLRDAGFRVDRLAVGRLPSESIIGLFATVPERRRFRGRTPDEIVEALADLPPGLYGVGLDFHAGLWVVRDPDAAPQFCHSSPAAGVICEDPADSPVFPSKYTVVGPLLTDRAVDRWLAAEAWVVPER